MPVHRTRWTTPVQLNKVDLKSFDDRHYRQLGGRLEPILDTIRRLHAVGVWVEIVTLLIPGFNDSRDELLRLTSFVAGVSPDIPWHVAAFHGDYRMTDSGDTTADMLLAAADIGRANGLRHVYAGSLPGQVGEMEDTRCPSCRAPVPGRWDARFGGQIADRPFRPGNVQFIRSQAEGASGFRCDL